MDGAMMLVNPLLLLRLLMMPSRTEVLKMKVEKIPREGEEVVETTSVETANRKVILPVIAQTLKFAGDVKKKATKRMSVQSQPSATTADKKAMRRMNVLNQRSAVDVSRKDTRLPTVQSP